MEMLYGMYAFQALPILEPHHKISSNFTPENIVNERLHSSLRLREQVSRTRVLWQVEFGPDHQVSDSRINTIRPVVVQDLEVGGASEWLLAALGCCVCPAESMAENVGQDGTVGLLQGVDEMAVAAQERGATIEEIDLVGGCC